MRPGWSAAYRSATIAFGSPATAPSVPAASSQNNIWIERFWGVLQAEVLDREMFHTAAAAEAAIARFAAYYNYHRLHGELDWQTPAERYEGAPFTDRGFEYIPALAHLQGWLTELMAAGAHVS